MAETPARNPVAIGIKNETVKASILPLALRNMGMLWILLKYVHGAAPFERSDGEMQELAGPVSAKPSALISLDVGRFRWNIHSVDAYWCSAVVTKRSKMREDLVASI